VSGKPFQLVSADGVAFKLLTQALQERTSAGCAALVKMGSFRSWYFVDVISPQRQQSADGAVVRVGWE